jgi:hypothetical protein
MARLVITEDEKKEILVKHGFIKEQATQTAPVMKTREESLAFFKQAKDAGCLKDVNLDFTKIYSEDAGKTNYIKGVGPNGGVKRVYDNYTYVVTPKGGTGVKNSWSCKAIQDPEKKLDQNQLDVLQIIGKLGWSNNPVSDARITSGEYIKDDLVNPTNTDLQKYKGYFSTYPNFFVFKKVTENKPAQPVKPLTPEEKQLQQLSTAQATDQLLRLVNEKFATGHTIEDCTKLVDAYFEAAQDGQPNNNLPEIKKQVYACNSSNMSKWSPETKDKLRWLRGNEEDAKKIFGLFRRYPKDMGTIRSNQGRQQWQLNELPQVN